MRLSRLFSMSIVIGATAAATIIACGGDSKTTPDSKVYMDAKVFMDAPAGGGNAVGMACMAGSGNPQGNCPSGYICAAFQGGHGAFCTKPCTQGSGDTCAAGYTGVGFPACIVQVGSGATAQTVCGIICAEKMAGSICPSGACTGACPSPLTCTVNLTTGSGATVGSACI